MNEEMLYDVDTYEELTVSLSRYTVDGNHVYEVSTEDGEVVAIIDKMEDWRIE